MLIGGFGGGVPCSVTTPVIALAVAGSTGSVSGAAAFDAVDRRGTAATGGVDHRHAQCGARAGEVVDASITPEFLNYDTPPAAVILRSTRSCIHCELHQSTGVTCWPPTMIEVEMIAAS